MRRWRNETAFNSYITANSCGGCPICLEEYKDGDYCAALVTCHHTFHVDCITAWLLDNDTCPLCRSLV
ncbi:hypothetical protein ACS0TY_020546 [Phlomoides rotata]